MSIFLYLCWTANFASMSHSLKQDVASIYRWHSTDGGGLKCRNWVVAEVVVPILAPIIAVPSMPGTSSHSPWQWTDRLVSTNRLTCRHSWISLFSLCLLVVVVYVSNYCKLAVPVCFKMVFIACVVYHRWRQPDWAQFTLWPLAYCNFVIQLKGNVGHSISWCTLGQINPDLQIWTETVLSFSCICWMASRMNKASQISIINTNFAI